MKIRVRTARWVSAALLGGAAVLAPAAAASASHARSASSAVLPACETPGLVIWFNPNGNAALGSAFFHLRFTNLSGHACTLNGFPFLFAINLRGRQVGHRALSGGSTLPITIRNGKTVHSLLQIVDALNYPTSKCHPVTAAGFKVFPPNQGRAKTVPFPFLACSATGPHFLRVGKLQRGL